MGAQVALVTGGGRGIGRGIALALARAGWQVAINYRGDAAAAQETLRLLQESDSGMLAIQADISSARDRARLLETVIQRFQRLDVLVNNAGMAPRQRTDLLSLSEASFDEVLSVNLKGPFFLTQQAAQIMLDLLKAGQIVSPKIINISSISAYTASLNRGEYCISKAGVAMMTALFADRLAAEGVNVYEIRPGIIQTDMTAGVQEKYDALIAGGLTPIRRWGQPEDVARAVLAIASDALPFSTGEVINVDGGFHLRRL